MLSYSDPTGTGLLQQQNALEQFRAIVDRHYDTAAQEAHSAFTWLEAFSTLRAGATPARATIPWRAFPITANAPNAVIDRDRFELQDEYVEWRVERGPEGSVEKITFTTEFVEYYEALAFVSEASLIAGIRAVEPDANPTSRELFGTIAAPATAKERARRFLRHRAENPWNNGEKGILCLTLPANSMSALFQLVADCAQPRTDVPAASVCSLSNCVPGRASDPAVCLAAQNGARGNQVITLADPVGVELLDMGGIWKLGGKDVRINDLSNNHEIWKVTRNRRRGELIVSSALTLDGEPIRSGAQVAAVLRIGAAVLMAPADVAPDWALTGNESMGKRA